MTQPPRQIGSYRVQRQIGQGVTEVYLARHPRYGEVALKLLPPFYTQQREAEARFRREARLLKQLRHPNILRLYDTGSWQRPGESSRYYFIAAEYLPDGSLHDLLRSHPRGLPEAHVVALAVQIADALAYAHDRNIVHRDLKPNNILLRRGQVVLGDFGIARELAERTIGQGQSIIGTVAYMSPEQTWGNPYAVGRGSDIYSFGVLCYELLSGSQPRANPELLDVVVMQMIREQPLPPLAQVVPHVTPDVAAIIQRCLEPQRANRYTNMHQVAELLRHAARRHGYALSAAELVVPQPGQPGMSWTVVVLTSVALVLVFIIVLLVILATLPVTASI